MPRPNGTSRCTPRSSARAASRSRCRSAPRRCTAGRGGHRRALEVQGRPRRRPARRAVLPVDAPAARVAAGDPRPAGVHQQPEDRSLPGGGLHLHAERRGQGAAQGRDAARLRLCDPHRRRPPLRRRARERQDGAAAHATQERRHRRDRDAGQPHAEPRLAELRRDLARPAEDPPLRPAGGEGPQHRAGAEAVREGSAALQPQPEDAHRDRGVPQVRRRLRRRQGATI